MANQVLIVAILMIVQGVLECLMGLFLVVMAFIVPSMMEMARRQQGAAAPPGLPAGFSEILTGVYLTMGVCGLLAGIPHIIAGIRNISYRGRTFGIVALFLSIFSFATVYCAPTSLGVMIYGLIVYFNRETARAFELGEQGLSREQVSRTIEREREGGPWMGPPGGERDRVGEREPPRLPPPTAADPRFVDRDRSREPEGPRQPPEA